MAVYSELVLTFTSDWFENDLLKIQSVYNNAVYMQGQWTWVLTRSAGFEVTQGLPTVNDGERAAINFKAAFDLDFPTGYITTVQNVNEVLIQSELENEFWVNVATSQNNVGTIDADFAGNDDPGGLIQDITVMIERYYIEYCDDFNTDRKVSILERGYVGISLALLADVNPISLTYESSEDFKFSPIRPSVAQVNMIFGSGDGIDFEEFWTADERQFMVQDIKDGVVEWSGFVIADGFQYEFHGGLYHASIEASDGLATLDSLIFVDDNQRPYGNQNLVYNDGFSFPFILIITEILKKLGLELDIWTCVDSYETNMTKVGDVREADPLSVAYVNVKTFIKAGENQDIPYWYGSGEEWNCKEVLENILYIFGAKIYQEYGVWRLKTINADADYGTGVTQRYWRKYNNVATYLGGYEVVDDEIAIPCNDKTKYLLENDHVMSMDDVYKAFRMNYEYTFVRFGDTPVNLLPNGNFCDFNNNSILAAPDEWERWRSNNSLYIRLKDITIPFADAGGNTCGIEIGTQKTGIPITGTDRRQIKYTGLITENIAIRQSEVATFSTWSRYRFAAPTGNIVYYPTYKMVIIGDNDEIYYLRNTWVIGRTTEFVWEKVEGGTADNFNYLSDAAFFVINAQRAENYVADDARITKWYENSHELPPVPVNGVLSFGIYGLSSSRGNDDNSFPVWLRGGSSVSFADGLYSTKVILDGWVDEGGVIPRLQLTAMELNIIPNENELPRQQDFIYENTNTNYSLQVDPITVFNGDLQDENHVSNITVPTNTGSGKNFWDDLSGAYGSSSLGLLTVKAIMRQYQKPYRILEGSVKIQDARFGSVYTFQVLPNVRFILQRGSFNKQKQYIEDATFVQITDDVLPSGGSEGGNTLEPEWVATGNTYCEVDGSGLNTGYVITEETDANPNSETYEETQEIVSDAQDLDSCPLGSPRLYYWGSDDIYLNVATLTFSPFTVISAKEIQISMSNDEGNYLYFVHKKTLGVVERIYTPTSPNNVLSDWVYLSDVIIDGYLYRVLRTDYIMTEFSNFTHNFKFA